MNIFPIPNVIRTFQVRLLYFMLTDLKNDRKIIVKGFVNNNPWVKILDCQMINVGVTR